MKVLKQVISFKEDIPTLWLIEVQYAILCPMVHWIIGFLNVKKQGPKSKDEKVTSLLSPFRDRKADILAERGNQKGSPGFIGPIRKIACKKSFI